MLLVFALFLAGCGGEETAPAPLTPEMQLQGAWTLEATRFDYFSSTGMKVFERMSDSNVKSAKFDKGNLEVFSSAVNGNIQYTYTLEQVNNTTVLAAFLNNTKQFSYVLEFPEINKMTWMVRSTGNAVYSDNGVLKTAEGGFQRVMVFKKL
jgi:hypothetical protein